jgi:acetyl-CoA carboxylase biotin carboxylase subunit
MFKKILIANRGEIAVRIIRTCRDMGIVSVAVFSEADRESLHVQIADEAVCIGAAHASESYLDTTRVLSAALAMGAEAVHPGFGFLSENADFAKKCAEYGLVFIGPGEQAMRLMGDKIAARHTAREAGVPVTPGSDGVVTSYGETLKIAGEVGYPLMIKAAAGGGGRGIRRVEREEELQAMFDAARSEAEACFGDGRLYIEKCVVNPRHIEIQILADSHGNVVHLFDRDCTVQRRHQKLLEEAPSPYIGEDTRRRMGECAVRLAARCGYVNAGTVEFLTDSDRNFYFCEMNTRIQVEHPVTEAVVGIDLIRQQIKIAYGERLSFAQEDVKLLCHAMECRINAEDSARAFAPAPGTIAEMHQPGGIGVRVDSGVYQGYTVPPFYDSMIAKLIVTGETREDCIVRMKRAISEYLFFGISTNIDFHIAVLNDEKFALGEYGTDFCADLQRRISGE